MSVTNSGEWIRRLFELAKHVSWWSKDPDRKVGTVIVDAERVVLGLGYNGFGRGVIDHPDRYTNRDTKLKLIVHAEANAVLNASRSLRDAVLISTKFPCSECTKLIVQCGIGTIIAPEPNERWQEDASWARLMLSESGTEVLIYQEENLQ